MQGLWVRSALVLALALGGCDTAEEPLAEEQASQAQAVIQCGEAQCTPVQAAYISHFTGPGCTGLEHYYTPYFNSDGIRRSWNGQGLAGTQLRTVTNISYRDSSGTCRDAWPGGNTLSNFVRIYRDSTPPPPSGVVVTPASASSAPLRPLSFSVSGGTAPYTWSFVVNNSGAQLSAQGAYRTGFRGNTTDVLRVTDSTGSARDVTVTVDRETLYLGAVYHLTSNAAEDEPQLLQMITELGGGQVHRVGAYYDVHLLVQTEWIWGLSHNENQTFNFSRFEAFASKAQQLGFAHSVLLNYHDVPGWVEGTILQRYGKNPRVSNSLGQTDKCPEPEKFCPVGNYMRFSPSSPAYSDYAVPWTRAAMQALTPYLGVSVNTIFCGNEMMYDIETLSSFDDFTRDAWRAYTGNPSASVPLTSTRQWQEFRSRELKKMFKLLLDTARGSAAKPVLLSTKLVPYELSSTRQPRTGVYPGILELMDDPSMDFVGANIYNPRSAIFQFGYRRDKPLYLSEFNTPEGSAPATRTQVRDWLQEGIQHYGLRWATFYTWNPTVPHYAMTPDQKQGMRDVASWVTTLARIPPKAQRIRFIYDGHQLDNLPGIIDAQSWMLYESAAERMIGAADLSQQLRTKPNVAYELGTQAVSGADLPIYEVNGQRSVGALSGSAVYLLTRAGARVDSGSGSVWSYSGDSDSQSFLARQTASFGAGALLFHWTLGWHEGNRTLGTSLVNPTLYVRTYDSHPLALRAGNTFFLGQDTLWSAYYGAGIAPRWPVDKFIKDITGELGY